MGMTAKEANELAKNAKFFKKYIERTDELIEKAVQEAVFEIGNDIPWSIPDEVVDRITKEYKDRGFEVKVDGREREKDAYIDCGNYSERSVTIRW